MTNWTPIITTLVFFLALYSCNRPDEENVVPIPTSLTLKVMHHDLPVADVNVFIKYNQVAFPGFDKQPDYFDTLLVSDGQGIVRIKPVLQGQHWAVAFGASEHGIVLPIYGSMPFLIDLNTHPVVDTMLFTFE